MIAAALSIITIFIVLVVSEMLWQTKRLKGELGRKFVHITVGSFVAFWPFYMSFHYVRLISLAFLLVVLASRRFNIFKSVHTIDRKSWGDVLFACGIGLTALMTSSQWIFMAAVLHLSLADGLAAVVGKRYGKKYEYRVLGQTKSIAGTFAFWLVSLIILSVVFSHGLTSQVMALPLLMWLPLVAAAIENMGLFGLDNVFVPVLIVVALSQL